MESEIDKCDGIKKPDDALACFVNAVKKEIKEGNTVMEFGTRLYIWRPKPNERVYDEIKQDLSGQAYATRHISDEEYEAVKPLLKGAFRDEFRNEGLSIRKD